MISVALAASRPHAELKRLLAWSHTLRSELVALLKDCYRLGRKACKMHGNRPSDQGEP